jgi:opacity protein-like surface antigen
MLFQNVVRAAALVVAVIGTATAQSSPPDSSPCPCRIERDHHMSEFARRSSGSFAIIQSRPMGGLKSNIGFGYGGSGAYVFRLDRAGFLSLRADAALLDYGNESMHVPLSSTIGGRIQVKVITSNYIVPVSIGPQLAWPTGSIRPYITAGVGGQFFYTDSHVADNDGNSDAFRTTNQSDQTGTWVAGGGIYVPITNKRGMNATLDLGIHYVNGGRAQYLRPGSIQDLPNSQIQITPLESETRMALVRLGVRIGL